MKNLQSQKKELKIYSTMRYISIGVFITSILLLFSRNNVAITIGAIGLIISILGVLIFKKIVNNRKEILQQIEITQIAIDVSKDSNKIQYIAKSSYLSECENNFYKILKDNFGNDYEIHPQIPLSAVVTKQKAFDNQYQNELYRIIDFGIFSKDSLKPLLLIEINDKSHNTQQRKERDDKVKEICDVANINLITFWTNYPNTEEYVTNRIKSVLDK